MSAQGVIFTLGEKNSSLKVTWETCFNPFTPTSDQDRISPYSVNTISSR